MNVHPQNPPPTTEHATVKNSQKDSPLCIRISTASPSDPTSNEGESLARYLPVEEVKARVMDALQKNTPAEGAKVIGVGTTKTVYIIWFQDELTQKSYELYTFRVGS
ncbi:hypothetical protein ACJ73_03676 [Blastomyces percursus]|uniref:Uncharacterized protein n=1 Tax=Blastomyces percursus TaxID=1658174 RepID=A0A1J9RAE8_9EURO|nr:hypothetical protein ACJ73_03676 [Blastomyces percursus]